MEPLASNVCAFCGSPQSAITSTDVWPAWLQARMEPTPTPFQRRTNDVCESCSSGWMRRLDEAVEPVLAAQILAGASGQWTSADQAVISVWAIKTAMVLEFAETAEAGRFFTDNERWLFMRLLEPPSNEMKIWAAACPGDRTADYHSTRVKLLRHATRSLIGEASVVTITVGRMAFQIATRRFFEPRPDLDDVPFPPESSDWQEACIPLWPACASARHWPPGRTLDTTGLEAFAARWNELLNPVTSGT